MDSHEKLDRWFAKSKLCREIGIVAARIGVPVFAVGGVVRDVILDRRDIPEIDLLTLGDQSGILLAKELSKQLGLSKPALFESFGTAAVTIPSGLLENKWDVVLELVGARKESYRRDSRKPIVEEGSLEEDIMRRDFTVNAMAIDLSPEKYGDLIDLNEGMKDLGDGVLRTPLDPDTTFDDDPLRMIRGARFAAQLGFDLDEASLKAMKRKADRISIVSQERITDELRKMILGRDASKGFRILFETGILPLILKELSELGGVETVNGHRHKDNFYHTLQVLSNTQDYHLDVNGPNREWILWAALLHDIGKPSSKRFNARVGWTFHGHEEISARMIPKVFRRLRLPLDERMDYVQKLVRLHHRPVSLVGDEVTDSAVRRLLFDAGEDIADLMLLVRADITSKNPGRVRKYLSRFDLVDHKMREVEEKDELRNFQPPVDGAEIMSELDLKPGIAVGIIKTRIREAILDGEISNDHAEAFDYMMSIRDDSLYRAKIFDDYISNLGPKEKRAIPSLKRLVFEQELPKSEKEAFKVLEEKKSSVLLDM